jgi:hypothetical protein
MGHFYNEIIEKFHQTIGEINIMKKRNYYDGQDYMDMLFAIDSFYNHKKQLIIKWKNEFEIKCFPIVGVEQSSMEPDDEDYYGEFYTSVEVVKILNNVKDNFFEIYDKYIEMNIFNIPEIIMLEDGTVLWKLMT